MLETIGLMRGIGGKMNWLNQRHEVVSQNIANADTPNYRPFDVEKVDFGEVMRASQNRPSIHQVKTDAAHIGQNPQIPNAENRKSKDVYEVAPAENAVVMEEQLFKAQETMADYNLMTNLYRKNVGMIQTVIGN